MKNDKGSQSKKADLDDLDFDLEFDEVYSRYSESNQKAFRRRQTKRKLDRLKEKKWLKQNSWSNDYLFDFDDLDDLSLEMPD